MNVSAIVDNQAQGQRFLVPNARVVLRNCLHILAVNQRHFPLQELAQVCQGADRILASHLNVEILLRFARFKQRRIDEVPRELPVLTLGDHDVGQCCRLHKRVVFLTHSQIGVVYFQRHQELVYRFENIRSFLF